MNENTQYETLNSSQTLDNLPGAKRLPYSDQLLEKAYSDPIRVNIALKSQINGLSTEEIDTGSKGIYRLDENTQEKQQSVLTRLLSKVKNPLLILLLALSIISFLIGNLRGTVVIFVVMLLGAVLRFF